MCREQQKLSFRNERALYERACDCCKKKTVSLYHPESPYTVYCQACWWSDTYDPLEYGREYDFNKPFFEQFHQLNLAVPKVAIQNAKSENCEYTNYSAENKNCYLCVGCLGLRNKSHYIFNEGYSPEEYQSKVESLKSNLSQAQEEFEKIRLQATHKALRIINSMNSTGDKLVNCRNCHDCCILKNSEDCKYMLLAENNKDCYDCCCADNCELNYHSTNLEKNYRVMGGCLAWYLKECYYVINCFHSDHLFGCSGMIVSIYTFRYSSIKKFLPEGDKDHRSLTMQYMSL